MHLRVVELVLQNRHQRLVYQRRLAASADAAYADEHAQRKVYVNVFQVVAARPANPQRIPGSTPAHRRHIYLPHPSQVIQGQ